MPSWEYNKPAMEFDSHATCSLLCNFGAVSITCNACAYLHSAGYNLYFVIALLLHLHLVGGLGYAS